MAFRLASFVWVTGFCVFSAARVAAGQSAPSACGVAPVVSATSRPNIFSEEQEQWLGEAMADAIERDYKPARDASKSAYLQAIADKLAATLPATKIKFRVLLVDSAEVNGFSIAGGHIYITRKLAAAAHSDDELASVVGHEMGHIASHQFVFETTADLKRLLGVTSVGDRADVYAKFQQLMDARMRDKHPRKPDDDTKQDEADMIGVYVAAAAGYWPQALGTFWDRVFFVGGKTGDRVSDFFGLTKPDEKRLRGMLKLAAALPAGCGGRQMPPSVAFAEWHRDIVANQAALTAEAPQASREVALNPPIRMDLDRLRFSRDGKLILAQDEGSVFVLSRDPLEVKFRMDAVNGKAAEFSPDSQRVVFSTPGLHTEEWSTAQGKLLTAHEVVSKDECLQSRLSPDGRTLVCITYDIEKEHADLALLDTESGAVVWQKKSFFEPGYFGALTLLYAHGEDYEREVVSMSFSADGNVLLIGPGTDKIALDLRNRTQIKVSGALAHSVTGDYAFLGNNKVAGINMLDPKSSGIFSFPDGQLLRKAVLPFRGLESASSSDNVVLVYGVPDSGIGMADLTAGNYTGLRTRAMDIWEGTMIGEANDGSIALVKVGDKDPKNQKRVTLPLSPLGQPRSVRISDDGKYLALSTRFHGGVWDLETGRKTVTMRGFTDAHWTANDTLYVDEPKGDKTTERHIAEVTTAPTAIKTLTYTVDDKNHMRYGWLMEWKSNGKKAEDLMLHDPASNKVVWTKTFADGRATYTGSFGDRDLIFNYLLKSDSAKAALKESPVLSAQEAALKNKDLGRLIEVVDMADGHTVASMVMELPLNLNGTDGLNRAGDLLFVSGTDNRTMVYSIASGKQLRQMFGYVTTVDPESGRVCTVNRMGEALVYDAEGKELAHFDFQSPLRYAHFKDKAGSLVVLTADQKVRTMELGKAEAPVVAAK